MKYRKKPVVIEAMQWDGTEASNRTISEFAGTRNISINTVELQPRLFIHTLEGLMEAKPNDYIIKGIQGEFYPCKPDIFEATYEKV